MQIKNRPTPAACLVLYGLSAFCILSAAAGSAQPAVSTAAPVSVQSPLMLVISKDAYSSRVGFDYSIRWDFSDLASFKPGLGFLYSGIKAAADWDITENTRLSYYGFKTNPWRLIIAKEKKSSAGLPPPAAAAGGSGVVTPPATEYSKHLRLSFSPLVDDIKRNFDDGLRDYLLRSSLKKFSPEWEKMGEENRKVFVKDVLSIDIWGAPVPGMGETKKGLEYLSR